MNYRYKRFQIGKKLDVPANILKNVYNCNLSFEDYIKYNLDDKIPISCIREDDKKIIERFGIEKAKNLDWELLNGTYRDEKFNVLDIRNMLMKINPKEENINEKLYEKVKDIIAPKSYSSKMKEIYSGRLFFDVKERDKFKIGEAIKFKFNEGKVTLPEILQNIDLFKNKDISFCLKHDKNNKYNINVKQVRDFISQFKNSYNLILEYELYSHENIYEFIYKINYMNNEQKKREYIKQITDKILDDDRILKEENSQYEELFKYSSIEEYLNKFVNKIYRDDVKSIADEIKSLPEGYLSNMKINFKQFEDENVVRFIGEYGIKNVLDFDKQNEEIFSKNDGKILENMCKVLCSNIWHYSAQFKHTDKYGHYVKKTYSKEEFEKSIREMVLDAYFFGNFLKKLDFDNCFMTFFTEYSEILDKLTKNVRINGYEDEGDLSILNEECLKRIEDGMIYDDNMPASFKQKNPELFLDESVPKNLRDKFYNREITIDDIKNNPELKKAFEKTNVIYGFPKEMIWINDLFSDIDNIADSNNKKLKIIEEYSKIPRGTLREKFKDYIMNSKKFDMKKIKDVSILLQKVSLSNSLEMRNFGSLIVDQVLATEQPIESLNKIEDMFVKNHIPTVGKIFSCFEILHPDFKGFDFSKESTISPILKNSSTRRKKVIVFSDLVRSAFGSNNRSMKNFIKDIEEGNDLYEKVKNGEIEYETLNKMQKDKLTNFSQTLSTLYNNTMKNKKIKDEFEHTDEVIADIYELSKRLAPKKSMNYDLCDRIVKMFCGFAGIKTLNQAKEYMNAQTEQADIRNRKASTHKMVLKKGDLVKGLGENGINYLRDILQNGSVSKEYLGSNANSDLTPLDTDLSMISRDEGTIDEQLVGTAAANYGPIYFVLKNRDNRFLTTRNEIGNLEYEVDYSKPELFYTGQSGKGHYGIRTAFSTSDIDYIIVNDEDKRVYLELAMNGIYIPVANKSGEIIFSPKQYDELREKISGLSYYGENEYKFSDNLVTEETKKIVSQLEKSEKETQNKKTKINNIIRKALLDMDLKLKTNIDGDLTEGSVEFIDTGSTGRNTNLPGDGDFDFMMKLDYSILSDSSKLYEFKQKLLKTLGKENDEGITGNGDFRLKDVKLDDETIADIDITFDGKTNDIIYSTDMALQDRLNTIKKQDPEKYKYVIANIIEAKKVLKQAKAYKSGHSRIPQGGLGGVGIENWILQNGGSFIDAARSFVKNAEGKTFEKFSKNYTIWDFGQNHVAQKRGNYLHDNFVTNNMNQEGYEKMTEVLKQYIKEYEVGIKNKKNISVDCR